MSSPKSFYTQKQINILNKIDLVRSHDDFLHEYFEPFSNSQSEYIKLSIETIRLGSEGRFHLPEYGDFYRKMMIHIRLPNDDYIDDIESNIIKKIKFHRATNHYDRYTNELYKSQKVCKKVQTGQEIDIFVPLLFWFNKDKPFPVKFVTDGQTGIDIYLPYCIDILKDGKQHSVNVLLCDLYVEVIFDDVAKEYINNIKRQVILTYDTQEIYNARDKELLYLMSGIIKKLTIIFHQDDNHNQNNINLMLGENYIDFKINYLDNDVYDIIFEDPLIIGCSALYIQISNLTEFTVIAHRICVLQIDHEFSGCILRYNNI